LKELAKSVARDQGVSQFIREGTYVMAGGPQYETPAECRFLLCVGGDAVGMSTCHEAIAAVHCGIKVFGLSLITNRCILDLNCPSAATHEEVLAVGKQRAELTCKLVAELLQRM